MRTGCPPANSPWQAVAMRHLHTTLPISSMFDTFKSALFGAGASFAIPDSFSLDDLASLSKKVRDESGKTKTPGMPTGDENAGPLATLGLNPRQIEVIVSALTEKEKSRPGMLRPPDHRRVAARVNENNENISVTAADVASAIQHAAMLQVVMRRVKKALSDGAAAPTSWEGFADIVRKSQETATKEELKQDAASMDGAFPATRPCPCQSGRRYKSCCSPFRGK